MGQGTCPLQTGEQSNLNIFYSLPFLVRDVHEYAWGGAVCVTGHTSLLSFLLSSNILLSRTLNGKSGEEERDGLTMFHQVHYVLQKTTTFANTLYFQGVILFQNHVQPRILLNNQNTHM